MAATCQDGAVDERPIRRAASIVCVRAGGSGAEVLVVERSAGSRFLPGYIAFPGGAVDVEDDAHARRWFGTADEGPRAAALRELTEEVGLAVTAAGAVPARELGPIDAAPPAADLLRELCHWIAPPEVPVRFDARYYTAAVQSGAEPSPDGQEVAAAWWVPPRTLLDEWEAGSRKLYWPTWLTVTELAACETLEEVVGLHFETRDPTEQEEATMPRHVMEQE
jgi:8-oxo-dGTP pyrophosphatase MutT (NUDIX family)